MDKEINDEAESADRLRIESEDEILALRRGRAQLVSEIVSGRDSGQDSRRLAVIDRKLDRVDDVRYGHSMEEYKLFTATFRRGHDNDRFRYLHNHPTAISLLAEIVQQDLSDDQLDRLLSLVPDNIAEEEFLEECAADCRCEEPYQVPCAGVTAGGMCDDMRSDDQESDWQHDDRSPDE